MFTCALLISVYTDMYLHAHTPEYWWLGFQSAARSWNACIYIQNSNIQIYMCTLAFRWSACRCCWCSACRCCCSSCNCRGSGCYNSWDTTEVCPPMNAHASVETLMLYEHTQFMSLSPAPCAHPPARTPMARADKNARDRAVASMGGHIFECQPFLEGGW